MEKSIVTCHSTYLNNCMSAFIKGTIDFFRTEYFGRTQEVVVSTYEKAVQHYLNRKAKAGENDRPQYPFITMDPSMDFEPEEVAGRFLYNYPSFDNFEASRQWSPRIYEDDNVYIAPVLNRYKGDMEIIIWCSSVYDLIDTRFKAIQFFGGYERPIIPEAITGFFTLPDEFKYYTYENPYTTESYVLDWTTTTATEHLIRNINQNKMVWDYKVRPYIKLVSASDGSDKYGGSGDEISDHRLTLTLEWECAIPTHFVLVATHLPEPCHYFSLNIELGYKYIKASEDATASFTAPEEVITTYKDLEDSTGLTRIDMIYGSSYNYNLTESDAEKIEANSTDPISIEIPDVTISDCVLLRVYGKYGEIPMDFSWNFVSPNVVDLLPFALTNMEEDDVVSIIVYTMTRRGDVWV